MYTYEAVLTEGQPSQCDSSITAPGHRAVSGRHGGVDGLKYRKSCFAGLILEQQ